MPMPAAQLESSYYPYAPKYGARTKRRLRSAASNSCGLQRVYPTYTNNCQTCSGRKPLNTCQGKYPQGFGGRGYYNPSGTPLNDLEYAARRGTCQPQRGCLDPRAANYDKMALTHCQSLCQYPKAPVCIGEPLTPYVAETPQCAVNEFGETAEQAIYAKRNRKMHYKAKRAHNLPSADEQ
jgi:hypothetical protein